MSSLNESDKLVHLELLPAELQCQILTNIPNMQTLRALLGASPRYFQVYIACREKVLLHVSWNHITPTAVPIALDALEQRDNRKHGLHRSKQFTFPRTLKEPHEIPLETWERLLRFHQIVDHLISDFTSSRLVVLESSIHSQTQTLLPHEPLGRHLNLSQLEYARLTRAFYHLELYAYLFYDIDVRNISSSRLKRARDFLESLRNFELEELLCVRSYMIERMIDFLNKFEDDFMKSYLKNKPRILWSHVPGLNRRVYLFDDDSHLRDVWMESCLARGLESLSEMFYADGLPNKYKALRYIDRADQRMSVALIDLTYFTEAEVQAISKHSFEIEFHNNIEQPNEAWFWAIKFCGPPRIETDEDPFRGTVREGCDTNEFECWGYVIWDHTRLKRLGILTKSPSDISAIIGTDWLIKQNPKSLETRTREQEITWAEEGLGLALTEPRPVFDWENIWFESEHGLLARKPYIKYEASVKPGRGHSEQRRNIYMTYPRSSSRPVGKPHPWMGRNRYMTIPDPAGSRPRHSGAP